MGSTPQPLATPAARTSLNLSANYALSRYALFKYGDRDDLANPGDAYLLTNLGDRQGFGISLQLGLYIPGREVGRLAEGLMACAAEYDAEKWWLAQPVTRDVGGVA